VADAMDTNKETDSRNKSLAQLQLANNAMMQGYQEKMLPVSY
jgi:hypothetical protein